MTFEAPEENAPLTEYGKEVKHGSAYPGVMALYYLETAGHSLNTTKDKRYKKDTGHYRISVQFRIHTRTYFSLSSLLPLLLLITRLIFDIRMKIQNVC